MTNFSPSVLLRKRKEAQDFVNHLARAYPCADCKEKDLDRVWSHRQYPGVKKHQINRYTVRGTSIDYIIKLLPQYDLLCRSCLEYRKRNRK